MQTNPTNDQSTHYDQRLRELMHAYGELQLRAVEFGVSDDILREIDETPHAHVNNTFKTLQQMAQLRLDIIRAQEEASSMQGAEGVNAATLYGVIDKYMQDNKYGANREFVTLMETGKFVAALHVLSSGFTVDRAIIESILRYETDKAERYPLLRYVLDRGIFTRVMGMSAPWHIANCGLRKQAAASDSGLKSAIQKYELILSIHYSAENPWNTATSNYEPQCKPWNVRMQFNTVTEVKFMELVCGGKFRMVDQNELYENAHETQRLRIAIKNYGQNHVSKNTFTSVETELGDKLHVPKSDVVNKMMRAPHARALLEQICGCSPQVIEYMMQKNICLNYITDYALNHKNVQSGCSAHNPNSTCGTCDSIKYHIEMIPTRESITSPTKMAAHVAMARSLNNVRLVEWFLSKQVAQP